MSRSGRCVMSIASESGSSMGSRLEESSMKILGRG